MQTNSINERYQFVDLLKTIAIVFVVIYHFHKEPLDFLKNPHIFKYLNYFFISLLSTCVPIFFFINGALLLNKDFNLERHIIKLIRIVVFAMLWGIITLLLLMPIKNEYMSLLEFIKSLWILKHQWINHLWFFQALVVIYLFFPLIKTAYDNNRKNLYFFLVISFIMTLGNSLLSNCVDLFEFFTANNYSKNYFKNNFNFFNEFNPFTNKYCYSIVYFILGGLFLENKNVFYDKKWVRISVAAIVVSMVLLTTYGILMSKKNDWLYDIVWNGYPTIPTLIMVIAFFILSLRYEGRYKFLNLNPLIDIISKNTLGIYLVHLIWGRLFLPYFKELSFSQNTLPNLLYAILILFLSLQTVLILRRIPIINNLFII